MRWDNSYVRTTCCCFDKVFLKSIFRFTVNLNIKFRSFPSICTPTQSEPPSFLTTLPEGTYVTTVETTLTLRYHSKVHSLHREHVGMYDFNLKMMCWVLFLQYYNLSKVAHTNMPEVMASAGAWGCLVPCLWDCHLYFL